MRANEYFSDQKVIQDPIIEMVLFTLAVKSLTLFTCDNEPTSHEFYSRLSQFQIFLFLFAHR